MNQAGQTVVSRYTFCDITPDSLRWDDAFTSDGGRTWSHGWIMEFSRREELAPWPGPGESALTDEGGQRCQGQEYRLLEGLVGRASGSVTQGGETRAASLEGHRVLDGCAVMVFLTDGDRRSFSMLSYNAAGQRFEELFLDNLPGTVARVYRGGRDADGALVLRASVGDTEVRQRTWRPGEGGALVLEEGQAGEAAARVSRFEGGH